MDPAVLLRQFAERHGDKPRLFYAPGRVNLIGEHTDYNDGWVLPFAIERGTLVAGLPRPDRSVRVTSLAMDDHVVLDLDRPAPPRRGHWSDYAAGMVWALGQSGAMLTGAELLVASDVPTGAGLSSSAAFEIALGLAMLSLSEQPIDRLALARAGQAAEHHYVGTRCGIMDQLVVARAEAGAALCIDCRSLLARPVPLPLRGAALVLLDTRVKHELAGSAYNERRAQCEEAARRLGERLPGVRALRDVSAADFERHAEALPEPFRRRARHVVHENERTLAAAQALEEGDLATVGRLMFESHRSLRDDYEVSCPELDLVVETARGVSGVLGSRMTGGGFGGAAITLLAKEAIPELAAAAESAFARRFGYAPNLLVTTAGAGARELT